MMRCVIFWRPRSPLKLMAINESKPNISILIMVREQVVQTWVSVLRLILNTEKQTLIDILVESCTIYCCTSFNICDVCFNYLSCLNKVIILSPRPAPSAGRGRGCYYRPAFSPLSREMQANPISHQVYLFIAATPQGGYYYYSWR